MALPNVAMARRFYRAAKQRYDDAEFLLAGNRTTAAVYLAGYSVECIMKALILSTVKDKAQAAVLESYKGSKAHDFHWLRDTYLKKGGPSFPREIAHSFIIVGSWSTGLRYEPGITKRKIAGDFLKAVHKIIRWADERM